MFLECKKCLGILSLSAAVIVLNCPLDPDGHKCPYPSHQHTHQEVGFYPKYLNQIIVSATASTPILHPAVVDSYEDTEREGNTIYLFDVTT